MAKEVEEDSLESVGAGLNADYIRSVAVEMLTEIHREMGRNIDQIQKYTRYLSGSFYTDSQRRYAEREVFRLKGEQLRLTQEQINTLEIMTRLHYPVKPTRT